MEYYNKHNICFFMIEAVFENIDLYFSFSQTINEEKDGDGQHRDISRFVETCVLLNFLYLKISNL